MRTSLLTGAAAAAAALALVLSGCGSDTKPAASSSSEKSSEKSSSEKTTTSKKPKMTKSSEPAPAGDNPTILTYTQENGITQIPVFADDPTAPPVNIPIPNGWEEVSPEDLPEGLYGGAVYAGPDFEQDPPQIQVIYVRMEGPADPQAIIDVAGGELNNLPGYEPGNPGETSTLGEYPAYVLGGSFNASGEERLIAQKTVVIPAADGLYVLQLNVAGPVEAGGAIADATEQIDSETTIG